MCECLFVMYNLFCSAGFVAYAYLTKLENFLTDVQLIENDDNPWNNKKTEDFLRHLKAEMFTMVYPAAFILIEVYIGFPSEAFESSGPHDSNPV